MDHPPSESVLAGVFRCKVSRGKSGPILWVRQDAKVQREEPVLVRLPDGSLWQFRFLKLACKEAQPVGEQGNRLPELLRSWFGPQAGLPGSADYVRLWREGGDLRAAPEPALPACT